jgi:hypothetical protein
MDFLLGLLTGIAIGFIWGIWRATQSFIQRIIEQPEEIREIMQRVEKISQDEKKEVSKNTSDDRDKSDVKIEEHKGVVYLYDKNDTFLAQGSNITDALDAAEKRFPGRKFYYRLNLPNESNQ